MQTNYLIAYDALTADLDRILRGTGTELEKIEACFMAALKHWEKFKKKMRGRKFSRAD